MQCAICRDQKIRLGRYKQGMRVFSYEVGRKYRMIYNVNWDSRVIELFRVCGHKSVYGRD